LHIYYTTDFVKHHLNDARVIKRELYFNPPAGCVLEHTLTISIDTTLSPILGVMGEQILRFGKSDESRVKRVVNRKLASRSKRLPTDGWKLNDRKFNELHKLYKFTMEGCGNLWVCTVTRVSFLILTKFFIRSYDVSHQSIYYNPPWSLVIQCVEHLRACHSRTPLDTRVVILLLDWPKFKALTKELKLIQQLPKGEMVFMRTTLTSTKDPHDLILFAWHIHFWLITNIPVLSPLFTTSVKNVKQPIVTIELKPEAAIETTNKYLSAATALVIMKPCESEALMRYTETISYNELASKAYSLIDIVASLNFVSKEFVMTDDFYIDCKTAPRLAIRVAREQRISTTIIFS